MNIEGFRTYCLQKQGVSESFPFGESTLVFKVMDKMFALTGLEGDFRINLKCDPEEAIHLRERHPAVLPGYHMNKKHWNTVVIDGSLNEKLVLQMIDNSYWLVIASLPKKLREQFKKAQ